MPSFLHYVTKNSLFASPIQLQEEVQRPTTADRPGGWAEPGQVSAQVQSGRSLHFSLGYFRRRRSQAWPKIPQLPHPLLLSFGENKALTHTQIKIKGITFPEVKLWLGVGRWRSSSLGQRVPQWGGGEGRIIRQRVGIGGTVSLHSAA